MKKLQFIISLFWFALSSGLCFSTPLPQIKVAAIQYPFARAVAVEPFFADIRRRITSAAITGAKLIVLPELPTWNLLNPALTTSQADQLAQIAQDITPRLVKTAEELSHSLGASILIGSSPRLVGKNIFNTAILAFPDGRTVLQDKLFLTEDEKAAGWTPGTEIKVFDTKWGRTAILICFDSEFPQISQLLTAARPEMILIPSMTGKKGFYRVRWAAQARAIEHQAYVVVTGTVASPSGEKIFGQAAFITPQEPGLPGILSEGPVNRDALASATFDLEKLRKTRAESDTFPGKEQRARNHALKLMINDDKPR